MTQQGGDFTARVGQIEPSLRVGFGPLTSAAELFATPLGQVMKQASVARDLKSGSRVTLSPKAFIPLAMRCQDRGGYCTFAKSPARLAGPYLSFEQPTTLHGRVVPALAEL
jgi:FO synthase